MTNQEFNEIFRKRTHSYALQIINFFAEVPLTPVSRVISYQLIKSGTSVGANFRAFCRSRSSNERFAKICIVVEEADECLYWFELLDEANIGNKGQLKYLLSEGLEILKVTSSIKNSKYNQQPSV